MSDSEQPGETDAADTPDIGLDGLLNVEWVDRAALEPNEYNPSVSDGTNRDVLKNSIIDNGWTQPLLVKADGTIINGESRWFVSRHPDIADDGSLTPEDVPAGHIPVHVLPMDDKQAMAATFQHNAATGTHDRDSVTDLVQELDETEWALDRLEMSDAELSVAEETSVDVSDVDFDDDSDAGAFTETVSFEVSDMDALDDALGEVSADRLLALARFVIETELYEDVEGVESPDWSDVPDL
jgi:hypothetical protein